MLFTSSLKKVIVKMGITKDGLKIQSSIASAMVALFPASALGPAGPAIAGLYAVATFIAEFEAMMSGDKYAAAISKLSEDVAYLKATLNELKQHVNQIVLNSAQNANRLKLADLNDYIDECRDLLFDLSIAGSDKQNALSICNRALTCADKFLRDDFEIWRWSIVVERRINVSGTIETRLEELPGRFLSLPALPAYTVAILAWIAAREYLISINGGDLLSYQENSRQRHMHAMLRESGESTFQETLEEHIVDNIAMDPNWQSVTMYPDNDLVCSWSVPFVNFMTGERASALIKWKVDNANTICTISTQQIESRLELIDLQQRSGCEVLRGLRDALRNSNLQIRNPSFGTTTSHRSRYFAVDGVGNLLSFDHYWKSDRPGEPSPLDGPIVLGTGWDRYKFVFPGGGSTIYAITTDGLLLKFKDRTSGSTGLSNPSTVGHGWNSFQVVFGGGPRVIYAIDSLGTLVWYKDLAGPFVLASNWASNATTPPLGGPFMGLSDAWINSKMFSLGGGVIYRLNQNGQLLKYRHNPDIDPRISTSTLDGPRLPGPSRDWGRFEHLFGSSDDVIYGRLGDGTLNWHTDTSWDGKISPATQVESRRARYLAMFGSLSAPPVVR
jgi:hypothetical protein